MSDQGKENGISKKLGILLVLLLILAITMCFTLRNKPPDGTVRLYIDPETAHEIDQRDGVPLKCEFDALSDLHQLKTKPGPNDWLYQHKEPGQTFYAYFHINPVTPDSARETIYISMLGDFNEKQKQVTAETVKFMKTFFVLDVVMHDPIPIEKIPPKAQRVPGGKGARQLLTTYILNNVLETALPENALCYTVFTSEDLWAGEGWNFVFGQASIRKRVGVWSMYRNGDPSESKEIYDLCRIRTIKTALHETGHMLSMYHCIVYECLMNGANHREESDSQPLWLCPICARKLCFAVKCDPLERYKALANKCKEFGMKKEEDYYRRSIQLIDKCRESEND